MRFTMYYYPDRPNGAHMYVLSFLGSIQGGCLLGAQSLAIGQYLALSIVRYPSTPGWGEEICVNSISQAENFMALEGVEPGPFERESGHLPRDHETTLSSTLHSMLKTHLER